MTRRIVSLALTVALASLALAATWSISVTVGSVLEPRVSIDEPYLDECGGM